MLDRLEKRVRVLASVEAVTALHVGTGRACTTVGTDSPVVRDLLNRPFIPGSSFKGVLRSSLEALLRGRPADGLWACGSMDSEADACLSRRHRAETFDDPGLTTAEKMERWARVVTEKSCTICSLFGSPWLAARARVADLGLEGEWRDAYYSVRDGVAIARDTLTAADGRKYDFETVPPGTTFGLTLVVDNPAEWEMGLILAGFDMFNEGYVALGGMTSRGLGRVRIVVRNIEEKRAADFLRPPQEVPPVGEAGRLMAPGEAPVADILRGYRMALAALLEGGGRGVQGSA